jgi:hypothetical protein
MTTQPSGLGTEAVVDDPRTHAEETGHLILLVQIDRHEVQVHPVLDRFLLGHRDEDQPWPASIGGATAQWSFPG